MRGNRLLVIIAVVLIMVVLALGGWWYFFIRPGDGGGEPVPEETPLVTPTPSNTVDIVVAVQNIDLGGRITTEGDAPAVNLRSWPITSLPLKPDNYYNSLEDVEGKRAKIAIPRGVPITPDMLFEIGEMLSLPASDASLFAPDSRVAYAIPMDRQGGVAWGIRPGDHVDVVAALQMIPVSGNLQEGLRQFTYLSENDQPNQTAVFGSFETLPNGRVAAIAPANAAVNQVPNLIVQLTVQDAIVWKIGTWEQEKAAPERVATAASETGAEEGAENGEGGGGGFMGGGEAQVAATPVPEAPTYNEVEPVTLLVTREDVLVLKYLMEMGADLDLVLRPAGYTSSVVQTQPVWLRYVIEQYQLPGTMPDLPVAPKEVRQPLELPIQPVATPEGAQE
jgi:Flp pilus assembly protein CpaB